MDKKARPIRMGAVGRAALAVLFRTRMATQCEMLAGSPRDRQRSWGNAYFSTNSSYSDSRASLILRGFIRQCGKTKTGAHLYELTDMGMAFVIFGA